MLDLNTALSALAGSGETAELINEIRLLRSALSNLTAQTAEVATTQTAPPPTAPPELTLESWPLASELVQ